MSVKSEHAEYTRMSDQWKTCRDAAAGEAAVHAETTRYLPELQEEDPASYALRLKMTPFFNASWRTIDGLRGMMLRKPAKTEMSTALAELVKNVDMSGTDIAGLTSEVIEEALTVGRVGLLIDYPPVANIENVTLADAKAMGLRAKIAVYKAETIINWRTVKVGGATVTSLIVLEEKAEMVKEDDEFETVCEDHYRVLDLINGVYRQRLFKVSTDTDGSEKVELLMEVFPLMNNAPMTVIPFVFIGVDKLTPEVTEPPLVDLINTNFKHYGQATSYERGCFMSGLPTMFVSGIDGKDLTIYVGGATANCLPNPLAKAYYVEITGNFAALRTNLEDKKLEMAVLGARMLETQKAGVEAEGTQARRTVGEESMLSAMAQNISQGITRALQVFAGWQGLKETVVYELNRDFLPTTMDSTMLTSLVSAWQQGGISKETLFDKLKQGEVIAEAVTFEEEESKIANDVIGNITKQAEADAEALRHEQEVQAAKDGAA